MVNFLAPTLLSCALALSSVTGAEESHATGYIFIGDSRTEGMESAVHFENPDEHMYCVAKTAMGYDWLKKSAEDEIDNIRENDCDVDHWVYICNLGVNDLYNASKYAEWAKSIDDADLYYVSVNPLSDKRDEWVREFNTIISGSGVNFIDTYTFLQEITYSSPDGIHYTKETNIRIFDYICEETKITHWKKDLWELFVYQTGRPYFCK